MNRKRNGKVKYVTWPTAGMRNLLARGKVYTLEDGRNILNGTKGLQRAPVTQCYFPGKNTIVHNKQKGRILYNDATFKQMEILEDLNYD